MRTRLKCWQAKSCGCLHRCPTYRACSAFAYCLPCSPRWHCFRRYRTSRLSPDLAFIDGHGIAHPRRFGIAAHFGVASGLPCIGVATSILVGESRTNLHDMRGAFTPLRDGALQIGWILRSKPGSPPLIISPGHRVALASAPELVMRYVTTDRLPETTRLAERLTSHSD